MLHPGGKKSRKALTTRVCCVLEVEKAGKHCNNNVCCVLEAEKARTYCSNKVCWVLLTSLSPQTFLSHGEACFCSQNTTNSIFVNAFLLFLLPEHNKLCLFNAFLIVLLPEHNKLYLFNAFPFLLFPKHNKLYLFNVFLLFMLSGKVQREAW